MNRFLSYLVWTALLVPPAVVVASVAFGAFLNSLRLGPNGFFFVIFFIGMGALMLGCSATTLVATWLSRGSKATMFLIWAIELPAMFYLYVLVRTPLGGWS